MKHFINRRWVRKHAKIMSRKYCHLCVSMACTQSSCSVSTKKKSLNKNNFLVEYLVALPCANKPNFSVDCSSTRCSVCSFVATLNWFFFTITNVALLSRNEKGVCNRFFMRQKWNFQAKTHRTLKTIFFKTTYYKMFNNLNTWNIKDTVRSNKNWRNFETMLIFYAQCKLPQWIVWL